MKKYTLGPALLLLLMLLTACGRREAIQNRIESEKAAESEAAENAVITMGGGRETLAPEPGAQVPAPGSPGETGKPAVGTVPDPPSKYPNHAGYQLTAGINKGGNGYYKGVTVEELESRYDCYIDPFVQHINTPTGIIFMEGEQTTYYNKLTGNVTHICPDPLCRHKDCVWANMQKFEFVGDTHIYFTANDVLFRSDMNRNHVEELGINMTQAENKILHVDGDRLYMQYLVYKPNNTSWFAFSIFDCQTKEFTSIYDEDQVYYLAITGGDTVWFIKNYPDDSVIYKADLSFTHSEKALETDAAGMNILMANDEYLLIGEGQGYPASYLYHIATGRKTDLPKGLHTSSFPTLNSQYLYYVKDMTEEEKAISPLKDYYDYVAPDGMFRAGLFTGDGRIYRLNLETGEEELCAEISYNGVPIRIIELVADGEAIHMAYLTYQDFHNFYNQEYREERWDGSVYYYSHEPNRYLYMDMTNGTLNLIDPYTIG